MSRDTLFEYGDFEFMLSLALGATYHRGADVGECLATAARKPLLRAPLGPKAGEGRIEVRHHPAQRLARAARGSAGIVLHHRE